MKRLLVIPVIAFALAGCGSDSGNDDAASTTPAPPPATNPSSPPSMGTTSTVDCQLDGATKSPEVNASSETPETTMYLTDVSFKSANCASSVEFDLKPRRLAPGYRVSYETAETAKVEDGSGNPVEIAGNAFLVVRLTPAMTATIDGEQVTKTYTGPNRLSSEEAPITEVVKTGDFEGMVTWVIGLDHVRPFLVTASDGILLVDIESS